MNLRHVLVVSAVSVYFVERERVEENGPRGLSVPKAPKGREDRSQCVGMGWEEKRWRLII
jgi:hypothetical protein